MQVLPSELIIRNIHGNCKNFAQNYSNNTERRKYHDEIYFCVRFPVLGLEEAFSDCVQICQHSVFPLAQFYLNPICCLRSRRAACAIKGSYTLVSKSEVDKQTL